MYSVVLMVAMTSGGEVADCHRRCHGCHGGCYGGWCGGCYGGWCGGCYGYRHGCCGYSYGCCGCYGCYGGVIHENGKKGKDEVEEVENKVSMNAPARLIVSLPADATLTINGKATKSTSARRVFVTPTLTAGKSYSYTLKAQVEREGKNVELQQVVTVRAGKTHSVTLAVPEAVAQR